MEFSASTMGRLPMLCLCVPQCSWTISPPRRSAMSPPGSSPRTACQRSAIFWASRLRYYCSGAPWTATAVVPATVRSGPRWRTSHGRRHVQAATLRPPPSCQPTSGRCSCSLLWRACPRFCALRSLRCPKRWPRCSAPQMPSAPRTSASSTHRKPLPSSDSACAPPARRHHLLGQLKRESVVPQNPWSLGQCSRPTQFWPTRLGMFRLVRWPSRTQAKCSEPVGLVTLRRR
mmetsp:Transcript_158912/g.506031  ORF Transcript_158912/g.506031 Transcript_158912/m.506031 type:complete len:231 (+) Transcript_158912:141-833(+)